MAKERLTIMLDEIDAIIDGINVRNRSHAIERLIEIALSQNAPRKAIILAGVRLYGYVVAGSWVALSSDNISESI